MGEAEIGGRIHGLHHVTSMASNARRNNAFFTDTLGLRRVKKTVNFDAPEVYHLYYGDERGSPGTVMTCFPFPDIPGRRRGGGEVGETAFAIPPGAAGFWRERLEAAGVGDLRADVAFGAHRLHLSGPDGEELALVETEDGRTPWHAGTIPEAAAIRGFQGVTLRLADPGPTAELLAFMGYAPLAHEVEVTRWRHPAGNGADAIDIAVVPGAAPAAQGAGSVHHVAFAVPDRAAQLAVRQALVDQGHRVTPVIDRDYFWSIYFRSPGGVLFEVATGEPGFDRDEDLAHLGEALKLPRQHAHLREWLEQQLEPIG